MILAKYQHKSIFQRLKNNIRMIIVGAICHLWKIWVLIFSKIVLFSTWLFVYHLGNRSEFSIQWMNNAGSESCRTLNWVSWLCHKQKIRYSICTAIFQKCKSKDKIVLRSFRQHVLAAHWISTNTRKLCRTRVYDIISTFLNK